EGAAPLPERRDFPEAVRGLALFGRIDRLDESAGEAGRRLRVVDYKYTGASRVSTDLAPGAVSGRNLQPPVYLLLAPALAGGEAPESVSAEFHYAAPNLSSGSFAVGTFPGDCWEGELGRQAAEAIDAILRGIRRGEFFVRPHDWACRSCEFAALCRKSHRATRYRLAADRRPRALDDLAETEPIQAGGGGRKRGRKGAKR
ncbi:MAG: PD-(D/E)XK nuclease family protein, partial [Planctomycetota bacterium]